MKKIDKINSNIKIQTSAYKMAEARSKAFIVGEIKDGKTTEDWKEYRKIKTELGNIIGMELDKAISQTRKECYDEMREMIKEYCNNFPTSGEDANGIDLEGCAIDDMGTYLAKQLDEKEGK